MAKKEAKAVEGNGGEKTEKVEAPPVWFRVAHARITAARAHPQGSPGRMRKSLEPGDYK